MEELDDKDLPIEDSPSSEGDAGTGEIKKGSIVSGEVTNITAFGAFVKLPNGQEGLVHISEIANKYVTDITKHVTVGEVVPVKILSMKDNNKLELSIRKAKEQDKEPALFIHKKTKNTDFEDKISQFLKRSEEKQIDIRRNLKLKQGISKKKGK